MIRAQKAAAVVSNLLTIAMRQLDRFAVVHFAVTVQLSRVAPIDCR
jgi:hypothetical protein